MYYVCMQCSGNPIYNHQKTKTTSPKLSPISQEEYHGITKNTEVLPTVIRTYIIHTYIRMYTECIYMHTYICTVRTVSYCYMSTNQCSTVLPQELTLHVLRRSLLTVLCQYSSEVVLTRHTQPRDGSRGEMQQLLRWFPL